MEKIRKDLMMIIYKYNQEKRGAIGRGLVDPELVDNLAEYLDGRLKKARKEVERLNERDGSAKIRVLVEDGPTPFTRVELKHVDFGVADNVYIVELPKDTGYRISKLNDNK